MHMDHGVPAWRNQANKTRIWVNWYSFALEKEAELGGGGRKLYFSPEFWGLKAVKRDSGLASEIDLERLDVLRQKALDVVRARGDGNELGPLQAWKSVIKDIKKPSELSAVREMVIQFWSLRDR